MTFVTVTATDCAVPAGSEGAADGILIPHDD